MGHHKHKVFAEAVSEMKHFLLGAALVLALVTVVPALAQTPPPGGDMGGGAQMGTPPSGGGAPQGQPQFGAPQGQPQGGMQQGGQQPQGAPQGQPQGGMQQQGVQPQGGTQGGFQGEMQQGVKPSGTQGGFQGGMQGDKQGGMQQGGKQQGGFQGGQQGGFQQGGKQQGGQQGGFQQGGKQGGGKQGGGKQGGKQDGMTPEFQAPEGNMFEDGDVPPPPGGTKGGKGFQGGFPGQGKGVEGGFPGQDKTEGQYDLSQYGDYSKPTKGQKQAAPTLNIAPIDFSDLEESDTAGTQVQALIGQGIDPVLSLLNGGKVKKSQVKAIVKKVQGVVTPKVMTQVCGSFEDEGDQSDCVKAYGRLLKDLRKVKTVDDLTSALEDFQSTLSETAGLDSGDESEELDFGF
ncbi:MAG: hypothetical protein AAB588_01325 [Patescibacteria group bacterium]